MTVRVPAKVNLQLAVGPARADGFHDLVNVFHAVSLFDEVTVQYGDPARTDPGVRLRIEGGGRGVPRDQSNLACRAVALLAEVTGHHDPVDIVLRKSIPVAGGMAGGSADAAAALVACDALWGTGCPPEELARLAGRLGSDVPFALLGGTAIGRGRGELLTPAACGGTFHWVFALAHGGLSTAEVYREYDRLRPDAPFPELSAELAAALEAGDPELLGKALHNDLQRPALALRPDIDETLAVGRRFGAFGAIVSGSGPTCAFLVADAERAAALAEEVAAAETCAGAVQAYGPVAGAQVVESPAFP